MGVKAQCKSLAKISAQVWAGFVWAPDKTPYLLSGARFAEFKLFHH